MKISHDEWLAEAPAASRQDMEAAGFTIALSDLHGEERDIARYYMETDGWDEETARAEARADMAVEPYPLDRSIEDDCFGL